MTARAPGPRRRARYPRIPAAIRDPRTSHGPITGMSLTRRGPSGDAMPPGSRFAAAPDGRDRAWAMPLLTKLAPQPGTVSPRRSTGPPVPPVSATTRSASLGGATFRAGGGGTRRRQAACGRRLVFDQPPHDRLEPVPVVRPTQAAPGGAAGGSPGPGRWDLKRGRRGACGAHRLRPGLLTRLASRHSGKAAGSVRW